MATTKRETLKFIRINANPSAHNEDTSKDMIKGYLNTYKEFARWDVERTPPGRLTLAQANDFTISGQPSISPYDFFNKQNSANYENTSFVIEGIYDPYDRRIHDLSNLSIQLYTLLPTSDLSLSLWNDSSNKPYKYRTSADAKNDSISLIFRINPINIKINKKKLFKKIRTRGGFVFQHWGPDIGSIKLTGVTGNITPDPGTKFEKRAVTSLATSSLGTISASDQPPSKFNSSAYAAFLELEKWYDEDQNDRAIARGYLTALQFRDKIYVGHIADFAFEERGTHPFQLYYSLTFLIHYDASNLSSATNISSNQIVRNEETILLVKQLKGEL